VHLSQTCQGLCRNNLDMSLKLHGFMIFTIPCVEILVKVGVMEFWLNHVLEKMEVSHNFMPQAGVIEKAAAVVRISLIATLQNSVHSKL